MSESRMFYSKCVSLLMCYPVMAISISSIQGKHSRTLTRENALRHMGKKELRYFLTFKHRYIDAAFYQSLWYFFHRDGAIYGEECETHAQ